MKPYWTDGKATLYLGDVRGVLARLPEASMHCVVTSPPYWGLRDYGTATWEGGDPECDHKGRSQTSGASTLAEWKSGQRYKEDAGGMPFRGVCGKCGAVRVDRQLGLEATPEEYVANMVEVFREVWRVLRDDGTLWLNIGDSYASKPPGCDGVSRSSGLNGASGDTKYRETLAKSVGTKQSTIAPGLKPKDLCGIPWMLAFALRADGWYLRSEIIWHKPNPMPESVTDRPTKSHEQIFLLAKSARYFFDAEAVKEPGVSPEMTPEQYATHLKNAQEQWYTRVTGGVANGKSGNKVGGFTPPGGRNIRSVWTIATAPYPKAHFATFPPSLAERCILAGTSEHGCCAACGAPWERVVERTPMEVRTSEKGAAKHEQGLRTSTSGTMVKPPESKTVGWKPTCDCIRNRHPGADLTGAEWLRLIDETAAEFAPVPCTVLDPFAGSGTTLYVARQNGCQSIGVDLSADYLELAKDRLRQKVLI